MAENRVGLKVDGREYAGWKQVRIVRSLKSLAGSFELSVSDKWSQAEPWPIREEDRCELTIDDEPVITGWVDTVPTDEDDSSHSLDVSGRDATGALVDCSTMLGKWEYRGISLLELAKRLAAPFSVPVVLQSGLTLPPPPAKFSIDPGDTPFEVLDRACRLAGLLAIADGGGGLLLMRPGAERTATALVAGENVKRTRVVRDATARYRRYVVHGQHPSSDGYYGANAAVVSGEATDENVRRSERVLLIRPEGGVTKASAKARAQWEATVRAARSVTVTVTVQGWRQKNGALWPINALAPVKLPRHGIDGPMLITQVAHSLDEGAGSLTELALERPDAYRPAPTITTKSTELWFPP